MSSEGTSSLVLDGELLSPLTYAITAASEPWSGRVHKAEMDFPQVLIMSDHLRLAAREKEILHSCSTPMLCQGQVILEKQDTYERN